MLAFGATVVPPAVGVAGVGGVDGAVIPRVGSMFEFGATEVPPPAALDGADVLSVPWPRREAVAKRDAAKPVRTAPPRKAIGLRRAKPFSSCMIWPRSLSRSASGARELCGDTGGG